MARIGRRVYPLRKVIDSMYFEGPDRYGPHERLECGHVIRTPQDIAGEYYAERRRCPKCAKGKPRDFDPGAL